MAGEPTTAEKLRGLRWSLATNAANAFYSQFSFFGSVFVLFLNRVELTKTEIGLILALIPFSNVLALVFAPFASRYGYKRVFVAFYLLRKLVTGLMIGLPWVYAAAGPRAAFWYAAVVTGTFATVRTMEETAYFPWVQEFVPNSVRGKYSATSNILSALAGMVAVGAAGLVLNRVAGLSGFAMLFGAAVVFGLISVAASTRIPGGALTEANPTQRALGDALHDAGFRGYLLGVALVTLGTVPLASFLPLFMEEQGGLGPSDVVLLQIGTLGGVLLSGYLWGWAADRYGSKPVMQTGGIMLVVMPVLWWLVPRGVGVTLAAALAVAFLQGAAGLGWGIGAGRLLFVSIVPVDKKLDYMAVYFAWAGLIAGVSQFLGGSALDMARGLTGSFLGVALNPYVPLFLVGVALPLAATLLMRSVPGDSAMTTTEFAEIFLRGNPLLALGSVIRFYWAKDEEDTVQVTEQMGASGSRLTVDELLDALVDPRFNVRFEAVLAIARMPPDPRLTAALARVLGGKSPALSVIAAWALGRIGDPAAVEPLRAGLAAPYRSVQGYSARALATLGDRAAADELLRRLQAEEDEGLRLAYASALGKLRVAAAAPMLLERLAASDDEAVRLELALAVARIVGDERRFIHLTRGMRSQPGTTAAQSLNDLRRHLERSHLVDAAGLDRLRAVEELVAREQVDAGATALAAWLAARPQLWQEVTVRAVLDEAARQLDSGGAGRQEYLVLALHTLWTGLES
jgi:HEAT repeat protein/Na+/melibiose symporter-like transporter